MSTMTRNSTQLMDKPWALRATKTQNSDLERPLTRSSMERTTRFEPATLTLAT